MVHILMSCSNLCHNIWQVIYLFGFLCRFQHFTGHIMTGSGRAEETSTYSSSGFCTVNCRPTASNYQLSHLRPCREPNPGLRGGRRVLPLCHRAPPPPIWQVNTLWQSQGQRSHCDDAHLHNLTTVPTKYQLPRPYSFQDKAWTKL